MFYFLCVLFVKKKKKGWDGRNKRLVTLNISLYKLYRRLLHNASANKRKQTTAAQCLKLTTLHDR